MNTLATLRTANRLVGAFAPEATARFARKLLMKPQAHRPRDWELGALERAERITFRFGLSGLRWGNSGPVVLAMHGWSGRATQFAAFIEPLLADVSVLLRNEMRRGSNLMFEGAQGALLDVDVGTYPFVTSSNTIAGEAAVGTGLGPRDINAVLGIVKAYTTRVGAGPFPTELFDETGEHLSRVGHEFGAVTGRPRRCGWFDAVAMRRAVMHNSLSSLGVTKLDVLDGLDTLRICTGYRIDGDIRDEPPLLPHRFSECVPVYEEHKGWTEPTHGVTEFSKLPSNARSYLARMEELAGVPIDIVSTGPDRAQTIVLRHPYD